MPPKLTSLCDQIAYWNSWACSTETKALQGVFLMRLGSSHLFHKFMYQEINLCLMCLSTLLPPSFPPLWQQQLLLCGSSLWPIVCYLTSCPVEGAAADTSILALHFSSSETSLLSCCIMPDTDNCFVLLPKGRGSCLQAFLENVCRYPACMCVCMKATTSLPIGVTPLSITNCPRFSLYLTVLTVFSLPLQLKFNSTKWDWLLNRHA